MSITLQEYLELTYTEFKYITLDSVGVRIWTHKPIYLPNSKIFINKAKFGTSCRYYAYVSNVKFNFLGVPLGDKAIFRRKG